MWHIITICGSINTKQHNERTDHMYPASQAFHEAVRNGNPQKALLIFDDAVFTNEDIDVDVGIQFTDYFNTEDDLSIGQALSNEISFALFNDYGDLNNYAFGQFTATLGVQLTNETYIERAACSAVYGSDVYTGYGTYPYIRKNGEGLSGQPSFPVQSILVYDGTVYAFSGDGRCRKWVNGTGSNVSMNPFMTRKTRNWDGKGYSYSTNTRILTERDGTLQKTYEFVPLGVFIADRPNVPDVIRIEFSCHDKMLMLDKDMPKAATLGITYPTTISNLFVKLCEYYGIPYKTATFINSGATIAKEPEQFGKVTARNVMKWIAEAAASNARIDRDGKMILDWIHMDGVSINETSYSEFRPYWYETPTVSKIINRDTQGSEDITSGNGTVEYLIQDNPLLKGFQ